MQARKTGDLPKPLKSLSKPIERPSRMTAAMIASKYPNDPAAQQAVYDAQEAWIFQQQLNKFLLVARAINADLTLPSGTLRVCLQLLESYPQALKVVEPGSQRGPGAPRKPRFKGAPSSGIELVWEVDIQLEVAKTLGEPTSISEICRSLSRYGPRSSKSRWRAYKDTTLETYYHEHKAELEKLRAELDKGPNTYWKYLEAAAENAKQNNGLLPREA